MIVLLALLGGALGFAWGIADEPRYAASASLLVSGPNGGPPDPGDAPRYAELASSERVATEAAGLLGDDVAGADLLSDVTAAAGGDGVTVTVVATSDLPDLAAAAADAFAEGLIVVTDDDLRQRLRSKRSGSEPGTEEIAELDARISALREPGAGGPLSEGAAAEIPTSPAENRSAIAWGGAGLGAGLLLALLLSVATRERPRAGEVVEPRDPVDRPAVTDPSAAPAIEDILGAPIIARIDDAERLVTARGPAEVETAEAGAAGIEQIVEALALGAADAPRSLAFLDLDRRGDADAIGLGVGIAAALRGLRVVVVESDLGAPTLADRAGLDHEPGLRDYLDGAASPRDVLRRLHASPREGEAVSLFCVPAGTSGPGGPDRVDGSRFESLVERLPRVYDLVLFEAPPLLDAGDAALVAELVDSCVVVLDEAEVGRGELGGAAEALARKPLAGAVLVASPTGRGDNLGG